MPAMFRMYAMSVLGASVIRASELLDELFHYFHHHSYFERLDNFFDVYATTFSCPNFIKKLDI